MRKHTIGEAATAARVTRRAVRLYESKGLVNPPQRTDSGYRLYTDSDIETLGFIRRARGLGLSLDAIAEIIEISRGGTVPCARTHALLAQRVTEIDAAIADLRHLRATIINAQRATVDQATSTVCPVIEQALS